mmetsp:Transcript_23904/g.71719  ORF Transcript_23904/g.71719 Transcript_23904/m.71719 type:complete len:216 (+) Transcript_23904:73-720(+)|eukprot:CAMPEP_0119261434 /NCGR_PEP_ID=MMETSP1329-20130426/1508_1 /TAXON_ID=114041 /ORGANISM="Genus nov. species nov., Strain RCC1024" /LENGTH=215 /DNA_ID=CAMNT_0007260997 /DNA_START=71 /DNA_END=718 /DNA_ORIENTATION=-
MSFKLSYFDARGVAETTRYMFAATGTKYEDMRYPLNFGTPGDFSTMTRPEFDAAKAEGKLTASLGRLPLLEYDGAMIPQSKTIERFVASQVGMAGSSPVEAAVIDSMTENIRDCKDMYQKAKTAEDTKAEYFSTKMPEFMEKIEASLGGASVWLVGTKMSLADAAMFVFIKEFFDNTEGAWAALAKCPKIAAAVEAFGALPEVKAWSESRPQTMF